MSQEIILCKKKKFQTNENMSFHNKCIALYLYSGQSNLTFGKFYPIFGNLGDKLKNEHNPENYLKN